jgi:PAS domain S-box-containing protein
MPNFHLEMSLIFSLANVIIGLCFFSIASALLAYLRLRGGKRLRDWRLYSICIFFYSVGIARVARGFDIDLGFPNLSLALDLVSDVLGVYAAITIWPLFLGLLKLPTNEQLDELNKKLIHSQHLFNSFMRFTYVNEAFCKLFQVKQEEVLGKRSQSFMPSEAAITLHRGDMQVLRSCDSSELVLTIPIADRERRFLIVKFPIWNEEFMVGTVAIDLTGQKAAEEREKLAERRFQTMVDAVKEYAIFLTDQEGKILTWNKGAERISGYGASEIIGKSIAAFYPPDSPPEKVNQELTIAKSEGQYQEENWRLRKDGSKYWSSTLLSPIHDEKNELIGFLDVIRDLSDKRHAELEIAIQRDKAVEASALKSAFVANISHEIRTPLSGILGMNELLLQTDLNADQLEFARTVQESAQSLLTVLNDVLDLSKIESGRLDLEQIPFSVSFATQDATRLMLAAARNKGLKLSHEIDASLPELVIGDPERLRQVLLNLIGNAVKFTPRGQVDVRVKKVMEDSQTVTLIFSVSDTGIGIAPDEHKYLFVPFAQVDASFTRRFGGTGLGLTISKHLIELMRGEIGFESEKGRGSTFWFKIPFPKTEESASSLRLVGGAASSNPAEPTVMVVEDNPILQDLATKQLSRLGLKVVIAKDGSEAIDLVTSTRFDAIFMDCYMPKMDGFEATRQIRVFEQSRNRRTPIIAMTAAALMGEREKAFAAGMDDFIVKPVTIKQLKAAYEKWKQEPLDRLRQTGTE